MSDFMIEKRLEDAVISAAVAEMLEQEGRELQEEFERMDESEKVYPDEAHLRQFEAALNKAARNWKIAQFFKSLKAPAGRFLVAVASVIIVFSVSMVSVEAFRVKFIDWLVSLSDTHTAVKSVDDGSALYNQFWNKDIFLKILPYGYIFDSVSIEDNVSTTVYQNNDNNYITVIEYLDKQTINIDNEDLSLKDTIVVDDIDCFITCKNDVTNVTWTVSNHSYSILTNDKSISNDELSKMIKCICYDLQQ